MPNRRTKVGELPSDVSIQVHIADFAVVSVVLCAALANAYWSGESAIYFSFYGVPILVAMQLSRRIGLYGSVFTGVVMGVCSTIGTIVIIYR